MAKYSIGVDLGGTNITSALINLESGEVLNKIKVPTPVKEGEKAVVRCIIGAIGTVIKNTTLAGIKGIGIGAAGQIDQKKGIILFSPNLFWKNVPLVQQIKKEYSFPVVLDNDANVAAYGEYLFGAGKKAHNMICVTLGTGVGGGIIVNGKIYRGANGSAGEIGHITIEINGRKCNCGNKGCVEAYVGAGPIIKRTMEKIESGRNSVLTRLVNGDLDKLNPEILEEAALYQDKVACEIWEETGRYLGVALASLINIFDPETIVVGGGIANAGNLIFNPLRQTIKEKALPSCSKSVDIIRAKLGEDAGVIGAAMLVVYKP